MDFTDRFSAKGVAIVLFMAGVNAIAAFGGGTADPIVGAGLVFFVTVVQVGYFRRQVKAASGATDSEKAMAYDWF